MIFSKTAYLRDNVCNVAMILKIRYIEIMEELFSNYIVREKECQWKVFSGYSSLILNCISPATSERYSLSEFF